MYFESKESRKPAFVLETHQTHGTRRKCFARIFVFRIVI